MTAFLFREDEFRGRGPIHRDVAGPDLPFTLKAGDEIRISISEIGELVNHVVAAAALRA
jgi:fumarylacetoacetate (FAA) hydrolase family protein